MAVAARRRKQMARSKKTAGATPPPYIYIVSYHFCNNVAKISLCVSIISLAIWRISLAEYQISLQGNFGAPEALFSSFGALLLALLLSHLFVWINVFAVCF
jgi:hypothetical protein